MNSRKNISKPKTFTNEENLAFPGRGVPGAELVVRHHSTKHSWETLPKVMTFNMYVSKDLVLSACAVIHGTTKFLAKNLSFRMVVVKVLVTYF